MCTMIAENAPITGSGKGTSGWIKVNRSTSRTTIRLI